MSNWTHRLGAALTAAGIGLAGIATQDSQHAKAWLIAGALTGIAGQVCKIIWPETDGGKAGKQALTQISK